MKGFLVALCISCSLLVQAQQYLVIEGQIWDGTTSSPLPFCSVFIKGKEVGTVANFEGRFKINIPESMQSDTLVISHVGYKNYYAIVGELSEEITVKLEEAPIDLDVIQVTTDRLSAQEIFGKAIDKINSGKGYPEQDFRMDGFFREQHRSEGVPTGVLECAISVFDDDVTTKFKDIAINQFRKVYDRKQNTDQFIDTKEGHNHLLLLLNGGINLIPLARRYKSSVWKLPLEIKELTYYNDRMVYVLANENERRKLQLYVDVDDFTVYKNELILEAKDSDYESYAWRKMNSKGEECGAVYDHQSYEYRSINGKLFPYYSFRRMDFSCFDPQQEAIIATAQLKKELLVNHVTYNPVVTAKDKLRKKQGLINRKEPYDSVFWKHFNDIREIDLDVTLYKGQHANAMQNMTINPAATVKEESMEQPLQIGDHAARIFTRADTLYGTLTPDLDCYDVHHYELDLEIDPIQEVIAGEVIMSFQVLKGTHEIRLDLLEHMTIDEITKEGKQLPFRRDLDAVYVSIEEGLLPRGNYSIKVRYNGHPLETTFGDQWTGGFMWSQDIEGNPFSQTLCQGNGAKGWFPVKNHLSDEPDSIDIKVTVPSNLVAVANGQLVKKKYLQTPINIIGKRLIPSIPMTLLFIWDYMKIRTPLFNPSQEKP
ncbi:MAG: carboxypeptidase-like regulatory domain-containing protein [Cytophagales bacterium]|nr:carboxypeptidase-like regulatory domain-containing protein [Cytophagales bacterium]